MEKTKRPRYWAPLDSLTKGELKVARKNWQTWRSQIQSRAVVVFNRSGRNRACVVCGYDLHVDVCHIKDVASFKDSATVAEINAPDNLVPLCKNHHWEFDKGHIAVNNLKKMNVRIASEGGI